jgi:hypothetical protein
MADSIPGTSNVPGGALRLADDLVISRMGLGAMQLAGPGVFGPPSRTSTTWPIAPTTRW